MENDEISGSDSIQSDYFYIGKQLFSGGFPACGGMAVAFDSALSGNKSGSLFCKPQAVQRTASEQRGRLRAAGAFFDFHRTVYFVFPDRVVWLSAGREPDSEP